MRLDSPSSRLRWPRGPNQKARVLAWGTGLTLSVIVVLADTGRLEPLLTLIRSVPQGDKLGHLTLMGTLAFWIARSVTFSEDTSRLYRVWRSTRWLWLAVFLEELSQYWIPTRSLDPLDLAADALGMLGGAILSITLQEVQTPSGLTRAKDSSP